MGIKEPPSIKTKAVTRQSSNLAYVIVWSHLRGCLCLLSKAIALPDWIGLSFNVELDLVKDSRISGVWIYRAASTTLKPDDEKLGQFVLFARAFIYYFL